MSECCNRFREHAALHGCTCEEFGNEGVVVESVTEYEIEGQSVTIPAGVATATGTDFLVEFKFRDFTRFQLFAFELQHLVDEMRVMASPHTERLEGLVHRFMDTDLDDDRPEDADAAV